VWPGISPHGFQVPTSVWNLNYSTWVGFAAAVDQWIADMKKQEA
jgi:hypothetical protein